MLFVHILLHYKIIMSVLPGEIFAGFFCSVNHTKRKYLRQLIVEDSRTYTLHTRRAVSLQCVIFSWNTCRSTHCAFVNLSRGILFHRAMASRLSVSCFE